MVVVREARERVVCNSPQVCVACAWEVTVGVWCGMCDSEWRYDRSRESVVDSSCVCVVCVMHIRHTTNPPNQSDLKSSKRTRWI